MAKQSGNRKQSNTGSKPRSKLKPFIYSPLPAVFVAISLVLAEYQNNASQVYPSSLGLPILEAIVIGLIPWLIFQRVLRSKVAVMVASLVSAPLFYDYEPRIAALGPLVAALTPISNTAIISLFVIALLLAVCGLIGWTAGFLARRFRADSEKLVQFLFIAAAVTFGVTLLSTGANIIRLLPQTEPAKSPIVAQNVKEVADKPDIYYLVLEDYANNDSLKDFYDFDNAEFLGHLEKSGFTLKNSAYSNYPTTAQSIPSTLAMDYLVDSGKRFKDAQPSVFPMRAIFDNPPIVQALKKQRYKYLHLGSWWSNTRNIPAADVNYSEPFKLRVLGLQKTLSEFESGLISKSVFGRALLSGIYLGNWEIALMKNYDTREIEIYQFEELKKIAESPEQGGRFIFGHIMMPHPPFVYNADGSFPVYSDQNDDAGATKEDKYVNQLRYMNAKTQNLIDDIKKNAKQPPVIILLSDEGMRPRSMPSSDAELENFDLSKLPAPDQRQKFGTLAAYDLPGAPPEVLDRLDSPVNAFRVVLDHYFGYQLGNLPDCSYTSTKSKPYAFTDVSAILRGTASPDCAKIHE